MNLIRTTACHRYVPFSLSTDGIFRSPFDDFLSYAEPSRQTSVSVDSRATPRVNAFENETVVHIEMEVPGVAKENLAVDVKGKHLTISGKREDSKVSEGSEGKFFRKEIASGSFARSFRLPFEIDDSKVSAVYIDGILKLEIPKPEKQAARKIAVH